MDGSTLASVTAILFAAAYLQSATGFGLALVCMALVPLVLPVGDAIAFVAIASFGVNLFVIFANRAGFSWRHAIPLSVGMGLGIPLGYYGLRALDGEWVVRLLGVVLMLIAAAEFLQKRFVSLRIPERSGSVFGLIGGILAGPSMWAVRPSWSMPTRCVGQRWRRSRSSRPSSSAAASCGIC